MTVFYRKYRPQKISELDSEKIKKQITSVLSSSRLPHAFLLIGPRGLGKTSTARIIAKSVNCLKREKNGEPCGECEMCESITNGNNLDVLEMDAASNRGIEEIRDLREKIKLAPASAKYKVYIIDEVHMLTNEAFNALLKTLEEPPEHAIFILCTTEPQKIPETITSRCMKFEFLYPATKEIVDSLQRVIKAEKIEIDKEALEMIANLARGSFRDGQKILDQLSLNGQKINRKLIGETYGGKEKGEYEEFLRCLANKATKEGLEWLHGYMVRGDDLKRLVENCLQIFHGVLLEKTAGIKIKEDYVSNSINGLTAAEISGLIELFSKAYMEIKSSFIVELPVEMIIIEWCDSNQVQSAKFKDPASTARLDSRLDSAKRAARQAKRGEQNQNLKVKSDYIKVQVTEKKNSLDTFDSVQDKFVQGQQQVEDGTRAQNIIPISISNDLKEIWPKILEAIKPINHSVQALLRSARPLTCEENCLTIEVFYKFHKERLEEPKILELLSDTISGLFGKKTKIKYILGQKQKAEVENTAKAAEEIFGN